jgi:hypothetical protein
MMCASRQFSVMEAFDTDVHTLHVEDAAFYVLLQVPGSTKVALLGMTTNGHAESVALRSCQSAPAA